MAKIKDVFDDMDFISKEIEVIAAKLIRDIDKSISGQFDKKSPYVLTSLNNRRITQSLNRQLNRASVGYDKIFRETQKLLADRYSIDFTQKELQNIASRQSTILNGLTIRSDTLKTQLKEMLLQNIGKKITFNQMITGLKALEPNYARYTYTIANTSLQQMHKDATWSKTSQKFGYFIYQGPKDSKNREYCAARVHKVYTKVEAARVQNVINKFYNCRHELIPISKERYDREVAKGNKGKV